MCSKRCAKPVRPGFSFFEPTWYHWFTWTIGSFRSTWRMTWRPLGSVYFSNSIFGTAERTRPARRPGRRRPPRTGRTEPKGRGPRACADSRFSSSSPRRRSSTLAGRTWIRTERRGGFGLPGGLALRAVRDSRNPDGSVPRIETPSESLSIWKRRMTETSSGDFSCTPRRHIASTPRRASSRRSRLSASEE